MCCACGISVWAQGKERRRAGGALEGSSFDIGRRSRWVVSLYEAVRPEARSVLHWHLGGYVSGGFTIQESLLCSIGLSGVFAASYNLLFSEACSPSILSGSLQALVLFPRVLAKRVSLYAELSSAQVRHMCNDSPAASELLHVPLGIPSTLKLGRPRRTRAPRSYSFGSSPRPV